MTDRPRILLIDDDHSFRSLAASILRKCCLVSLAADGAEGFAKALQHPPDAVIIDVLMPGWDGLKTLKAFRDQPTLSQVKTLMLTADARRGTVLAAVKSGANGYLVKTNFGERELFRKLNALLPGRFPPGESPPSSPHPADQAAPHPDASAAPVRGCAGAECAAASASTDAAACCAAMLIDCWE